jgi:hypothetical protein
MPPSEGKVAGESTFSASKWVLLSIIRATSVWAGIFGGLMAGLCHTLDGEHPCPGCKSKPRLSNPARVDCRCGLSTR